jgi:hypothetical protein
VQDSSINEIISEASGPISKTVKKGLVKAGKDLPETAADRRLVKLK